MKGALNRLIAKADEQSKAKVEVPSIGSFRQFLLEHAQVKTPGGEYVSWSLEGREAMAEIVDTFDLVLGSHTGAPLPDASIDLCGGAQFGKTILALNFGVYATCARFYNWGYYLPDDDLVDGIVDTKLRPDVVEQIDWLGPMMQVGKTEDKRGRSVNRKGAFQVSDGKRKAFGMIRGMGKIPTSFSMDVAMEDEKDDINAKRSKYLTGRLTASNLRLRSSIGTQRMHGAGQQKQWEDGSQGICLFAVGEGKRINLEENWPAVCRLAVDGAPKPSDPKLTQAGDFRDDNDNRWAYKPGAAYYLADPDTGAVIDRRAPEWKYLRPDRIALRKWSFRISQLAIGAIDLNQLVSRWQDAVKDPDMMIVFSCDVLALPRNTEQAITPEIITRAKTVEEPYDLSLAPKAGAGRFGGLDTGNRCWFVSREVDSEAIKRIRWAEQIPLSQLVDRTFALFHRLKLDFLAIDARPAVNEARTLCYKLNNLEGITWPSIPGKVEDAYVAFPGGLIWNGPLKRWENLRCAVVEFTRPQGGGILHKIDRDEEKFFPVIQCNRFESIDRAVREFLTPAENVMRVVGGEVLKDPVMRLPQRVAGTPPIVETLEAHLITGSKREVGSNGEAGDYVDGCENHLTLAAAYSALAELTGGRSLVVEFAYEPVEDLRPENRRKGGGL